MARRIFEASAIAAMAAALAFASVTSCSTFDAAGGDPLPERTEAGTDALAACSMDLLRDPNNCGACSHVCGATEACENGACRPGCADKLIHVSTTGDDTKDGCSIARAMKTIGAAVARAKSIQAKDHAVVVCRGAYPERSLVLDYPVALRGGYECSTFTRTKDFGYPLFDGTTDTRIDDANEGADRAALLISGSAVTRSIVIDGFTIGGARSGDARGIAVSIATGASPTLRDLKIEGGGTTAATGNGSRGLYSVRSSPDVGHVQIAGGTGIAADGASYDVIGLHLIGGSPYLHDMTVSANGSTSRAQAWAAYADGVDARGASAWRDITFAAGGALSASGGGLFLANSKIELARVSITGPSITCTAPSCTAFGLEIVGGNVAIQSSRISGGETTGVIAAVYAVYSTAGGAAVIANNVILAGNTLRRAGTRTTGVIFLGAKANRLVHNDIIVPEAPGTPGYLTSGVWVTGGTPAGLVDIENNLFVGNSGSALTGLKVESDCPAGAGSGLGKVRGNAFVNALHILDAFGMPACTPYPFVSVTDAETELSMFSLGGVASNVRLVADCTNDPATKCKPCAPGSCPALVLTPWDAIASPTVAELLSTKGYGIPPGAKCLVANGAVPVVPAVVVDFDGKSRGATPSIGAFELTGTCTP